MPRHNARVCTIGVVVAALWATAACSASRGSSDAGSSSGSISGQTITVYSGQHEQTTQALSADFHRRTGVTVKLKSGDEASLAGQLLQEGSAGPADVFYAENPPALTTVQNKKLLARVDASTLSQVPSNVSSPQEKWVGVSARTAAFAVNSSVPPARRPTSVLDLAGGIWRGKLGVAPGETDFAPIVTEIINSRGETAARTWLQGIRRNSKVYEDNETLIAAVDSGEVEGGVIDHYYYYRLRDEVGAGKLNTSLQYFAKGDPGAFVDVSGAGVLSSSSHKAAAQAFLAYLVSAPAQQIIATSHSYEYPLRPGVSSRSALKPLSDIAAVASPASLGDGRPALALLQDAGLL